MKNIIIIPILLLCLVCKSQTYDTLEIRLPMGGQGFSNVKLLMVSNIVAAGVNDSVMTLNTAAKKRALISKADLKTAMGLANISGTWADSSRTNIYNAISVKQNSLGYTPYNATNPSGYISSITGGNVTTALGFTPVANTVTVNGQALSGNVSITNVNTATALATPRAINGANFDGTAPITITANPTILASINATAQVANIATATLYAVPSTGFYRVSIYIAISQAATTSSTMPSTTIVYTDGVNSQSHSTATTATNTGNSLTTSFAQVTYICYAKTGTNITYATGSYASSGATVMQYQLRIRVEQL